MIIALHTHQIDISPLVDEKPIEDPVGQPSAGVPVVSGTQPAASFLRIFDAKRPVVFFWCTELSLAPDIFKHVCPKICGATEC